MHIHIHIYMHAYVAHNYACTHINARLEENRMLTNITQTSKT